MENDKPILPTRGALQREVRIPKKSRWRPALVVLCAGSAAVLATVTQARMSEAPAVSTASKGSCSVLAGAATPSQTRKVPWLGLSIDGSADGVIIRRVIRSDALRDFRRGDRLAKVGNVEISSVYDVLRAVRQYAPGDTVEVEVHRQSAEMAAVIRSSVEIGGIAPERFRRMSARSRYRAEVPD